MNVGNWTETKRVSSKTETRNRILAEWKHDANTAYVVRVWRHPNGDYIVDVGYPFEKTFTQIGVHESRSNAERRAVDYMRQNQQLRMFSPK